MTLRNPFGTGLRIKGVSSRHGILFFYPMTLALFVVLGRGAIAGPSFDFADYTNLRSRDSFSIQMRSATGMSGGTGTQHLVGAGQVVDLTNSRLEVAFHANPAGLVLDGRMDLRFIKMEGNGIVLHLDYAGHRDGLPDSGSESVLADRFLAQNGILTFHFDGGRRFVQISKDSEGRNRFVTEWGSTLLVKQNRKGRTQDR